MKVYDLKTNNQRNPLGILLDGITLSWKTAEAAGTRQKAARVTIALDPACSQVVYDSGEGSWSSWAFQPQAALEPAVPYYWRVWVMDETGDQAVSETAVFEGGHPARDWEGNWIQAPFAPEIHPVFQKTFELRQEQARQLRRARLYICGLGLYEVYLNGRKVGDQYLTPYFTDYRYWVQYQTYDAAPYLKAGTNRIDVYMGNGWYKGKFGYLNKGELREYYGSEFKLLAELRWESAEGGGAVGTDESWLALKSPVILSGIYDGEMYDARMEQAVEQVPERQRLQARMCQAPQGRLLPMIGTAVRRHQTLPVQEVITTKTGETVLDFGQEITGWVAFQGEGPVGQRILLQYGEVLQNGVFYRDNLRTAKAEYTFIANGKKQPARPHFTFYGFRYVKVTGMKVDASNVGDFQAWVLYSELDETGRIETSSKLVNRLIANTKWSQKDNFLDIPTDCPQRDERLGWTGDAQIFCETACYHMETPAFFRKYMKDMLLEQEEKQGAVPYVVPDVLTLARQRNGEPEFKVQEDLWGEAGASVWGDAATIIPWTLYRFYGNKARLAEQYDNMKQWTDFIIRMDEEYCGGKRLWTCGFHFGDWLSLDSQEDSREGGTDKHLVASVYYWNSAQLTARAAEALGRRQDSLYYARIAGEVRSAIRRRYVTASGAMTVSTQTAYVLGIHFHIFEEAEMEQAGRRLCELLDKAGGHLQTGFVGTAYLCQALTQTGHGDKAYGLLLNEEYPGWLYEVKLGATTIWERWNSLLADGTISSTGMNSLNHYAYGAVAQWLYEDVCGLRQAEDSVGFQSVVFCPHPDERLEYARAEYCSVSGTYRAGWERKEGAIVYHLEVPFNCRARFAPPEACGAVRINGREAGQDSGELGCGSYVIETR